MNNKFKKTIAVFASVTMVLSTSPFLPNNTFNLVGEITASAEGTEQQETDVASVTIDGETKYYSTLEEAFSVANGKTATITMLSAAKCVGDSNNPSPLAISSGNVTLNMNGKNLTGYGYGMEGGIIGVSGGSLTVQGNGTVEVQCSGMICTGGILTVADTTFNLVTTSVYANCAIQNGNFTKGGTVIINGGTITGEAVDGQIYHWKGNTTINNVTTMGTTGNHPKGVHYCGTDTMKINGGTFSNITVDSDNIGGKTSVEALLGDGCAYKHQGGTWATDNDLTGLSISNVTVEKIPLTINPQAEASWYYNSGAHSLQMNAAPLTDVKTISYEWYNGETKLDCTADTYHIPKALTVGKYTYTCKATCDGYTLSHNFEFEVETCPHTGLVYAQQADGKHGGTCTLCGTEVSEEHKWADGTCSVCNAKAVAQMEIGSDTAYYSTIEEAFTVAKGKTVTITLLNDVTASSILYVNSSDIIFNGGEYKLTIGGIEIEESSKLTINSGIINLKYEGVVVRKGGELAVIDGTFNGEDYAIFICTGGNATLSGGTFSNKSDSVSVAVNNSNGKVGELLLNYNSINAEDTHYAYYCNGVPFIDSFNKTGLPAGGIYTVQECKHNAEGVIKYVKLENNQHQKTCRACGYNEMENCTYGNEYQHDNTNHWLTCEVCGGTKTEAHNIIAVNKKESTCTENGNSEYWKCNDCGMCFGDSEGKIKIDLSDTIIPTSEHSFTNYVSNNDATCIKNGTKTAKCDNCDATDTIEDEESLKTGHSLSYVSASSASCNYSGNRAYWYCTVCGKYFSDSAGTSETTWSAIKISATGHRFTNYISNGDATCTEDGTKTAECNYCYATNTIKDVSSATGHNYSDGKCTHCGAALSEYGAVVKEVSATLDGNIGMNYYISLPQSVTDDEGAYVQFTANGKKTKIMVNSIAPETDGTYKFTYRMNAKEMHDKVTFAVYDGNDDLADLYNKTGNKIDGSSFEYTLADYFNALTSDTSEGNAALADLSKTALAYGSFAQKAFGYDVDTADIGIDISDVTVDTLENHKMTKTGEMPEGLRLSEMTLILESETTLCLYFKADNMSKYSFVLDNNTVTPAEISEENLYCIKIKNIAAKELDTQHKLVINDDCTITFDALSYAYSVVKAGKNDSVCDAVKALFKYNQAANKYFNELV